MSRSVLFTALLTVAVVVNTLTVSAQLAPWRLVSASDGALWIVTGDARHRVTPAPISDVELSALQELDAWGDGVLAGTQSIVQAAPPIALPDALVIVANPAAPGVPKVGQTIGLGAPTNPAVALEIGVVTVADPEPGSVPRAGQGRWVRLEWSLGNRGQVPFELFGSELRLQTAEGAVLVGDNLPGHSEPRLDRRTIAPGETARGFVSYDVPAGQQPRAAVFEPLGSAALTVAELTR